MDNKKNIEEAEAFGRGLPKWPQMLVTGQPVTVDQAKDIIFATDTTLTSPYNYSGGNDRSWAEQFRERTGYALLDSDWSLQERLRERANFLITEYVHNSWAACAFIYGPHGWCHPNGTIQYVDNVGKWPSVETIANEWKVIAARWPFLDLWVTLMDGEGCEEGARPVVTLRIANGSVSYFEGTEQPHLPVPTRNLDDGLSHVMQYALGRGYSHERGLPAAWIDEFIAKVRPIVDGLLANPS